MKKVIIVIILSAFISYLLFCEGSITDLGIIKILNNLDLEKEFDFSFLLNHTKDDLTVLLNVSFAKYGRPFKSRRLRDIFQNTKWYIINPLYSESMLTKTDKINVTKIYAILSLSPDNETLFYKIKRVKEFLSVSYPTQGIRIEMDNEKKIFILEGQINDQDDIWRNESDNKIILLNQKISFDNYGVDGWFIYNNNFYFFIEETVKVSNFIAIKIRRYLSCAPDYNKKMIYDLNLLSSVTDQF